MRLKVFSVAGRLVILADGKALWLSNVRTHHPLVAARGAAIATAAAFGVTEPPFATDLRRRL